MPSAWFPPSLWLLIGLTGIFQTGYFVALAGTYRAGDFSVSYPIARAAAVLIIGVVNTVLRNGSGPSAMAWAGMICIAVGLLLIPLEKLSGFSLSRYARKGTLLALAAAVCTVGYSMTDSRALGDPRGHARSAMGADRRDPAVLRARGDQHLGVADHRRARDPPPESAAAARCSPRSFWRTALTGASIFFTYTLVLLAMHLARDVSYVVAFRQLSVPIGAALGVIVLKEPLHKPKIIGIAVVTVGLLLVGLG